MITVEIPELKRRFRMRNPFKGSMIALAVLIAVLSLMSVPAAGQRPWETKQYAGCPAEPAKFHQCAMIKEKTFSPPRTPDGKPDFQGIWERTVTTHNLEEHPASY